MNHKGQHAWSLSRPSLGRDSNVVLPLLETRFLKSRVGFSGLGFPVSPALTFGAGQFFYLLI